MITQCISALAVLAIVTVALLVMVQAITLEKALNAVGRVTLAVILSLSAWCLVRSLFQTLVFPWVKSLLAMLGWAALGSGVLILLIVLILAASAAVRRFTSRSSRSSERGEL